jgi:outer membrane autotransporter protein
MNWLAFSQPSLAQGEVMQECRRILARAYHWSFVSAPRIAAALLGLAMALLFCSSPASAGAPPVTFCDHIESYVCQGPVTTSAAAVPSVEQQEIEARLKALRCEGRNDPACIGAAASSDSVSYAGLGLFVSGEYQRKNKTATAYELGFESDRYGPTIGADYRLGTTAVVGLAFDYAHARGEYDNNYGHFDSDTWTFLFYGSYFPTDQTFIDASVGFAPKEFNTEHADPAGGPGDIKSTANGFEFSADVTGGYDFSFDAFTIGPRLGLHYKHSLLNAFTESGTGNLFSFGDQVDDSLTGSVGFQASMAFSTDFGVVVPQINGEYVREFLTGRNDYTAAPVFGGPAFSFKSDRSDRNHFNVGAGVVFVLPDGISPFLNYEAEVANYLEQTHTVTVGVRWEM